MCRDTSMTMMAGIITIITIESLHFVEKGPKRARVHGVNQEKSQQVCSRDLGTRIPDLANQGCILLTLQNDCYMNRFRVVIDLGLSDAAD